ncbi:PAS-domain containing protein [Paraglaciecola aquimarina]|uniref:PAS-domain containing protein n=1 Tax=Paraglaciecola aquimarina TaxID=1235557 RepID=A0ABU3ST80_9ALTE|nr:PAS-domain containing protein [Paraglaciecola aquimarina]MDU0353213.1 PAS-domain containing protein [Paraglaciecola aquimarina]
MDQGFATLAARMGDFLRVSQDGYAIFTADDILQGCNQAFADILYLDSDKIIGKSFDELYRQVFKNQQGPKIDTLDIDGWLLESSKKRRSREFRLFEIDLVDGRWFLISEQTLSNGDLLLQAKNITKQKMLEQDLHKHTTQLTNIASTDELTQISNRRCLINQIKVELKRCARKRKARYFVC